MRNVTRKRFLVVTYALFMVVSNSYAKITFLFLPKWPLQTYVYDHLLVVVLSTVEFSWVLVPR